MKKIFIYGAGYYGEQVLNKTKKGFKILGFIDSDKKKINNNLKKFKIYAPEVLNKVSYDYIYIASMWSSEIYNFLIKKKISKKKIFIYPISKIHEHNIKNKNLFKKFSHLINLFSVNKINYYLDHSSLLSIVRDKDLLKSYDIDLAIDFNDLKKILKILKSSKKFSKIELGIIDVDKEKFGKKFIYQITIDNALDLQVKKLIKNYYYWIIGSNILRISKKYVYKKQIIIYKKTKIKIPFHFKKYLKSLYGENWTKPSLNWTYDDYTNIYSKIKFTNFKVKKI